MDTLIYWLRTLVIATLSGWTTRFLTQDWLTEHYLDMGYSLLEARTMVANVCDSMLPVVVFFVCVYIYSIIVDIIESFFEAP